MEACDDKEIFELVYDRNMLSDVVYFLEEGFNWSREYSQKVIETLSSIDKDIPIAAVNKSFGKITIAILLFHQGVTEGSKKRILNFSAWYAVPEKRGIYAINFARKLVRNLDNFVLTVYSAKQEAYKVFKSIGFSDMAVGKVTIGLVDRYPFLSCPSLNTMRAIQARTPKLLTFPKESQEKKIVHISNVSAAHVDNSNGLYYARHTVNFFLLKLNVINVFAMDEWPASVTFAQVLWLALKRRAVRINVYYNVDNSIVNKSKWLIYPGRVHEKVITPIGSELDLADK